MGPYYKRFPLCEVSAERADDSTSPAPFGEGFGLPFSVFARRLLTESRLLSFPAPNKMFQFGAFPPVKTGCMRYWRMHRGLIREPRVLRMRASSPGISLLATPFFGSGTKASIYKRPYFRVLLETEPLSNSACSAV